MSLIQTHLTHPAAKDGPLLLISWLSLVAFEDLTEFADLAGVPAEHLIQSLMYRLPRYGEQSHTRGTQENVKVGLSTASNIHK